MNEKEKINDWCFSYNPKILARDRDVLELITELNEKIKHYENKLEENEKQLKIKSEKNRKLYENKIKRIQGIISNLCREARND